MFRISLLKLHAINVLSVHFESLFKSEDYQEMSASPSLGGMLASLKIMLQLAMARTFLLKRPRK